MEKYKSESFIYYGPGDVRKVSREIICNSTDIVVKINVCGRCGTDKRLWEKAHPSVRTPVVLGHELTGEIVEIGKDVKKLTAGIGYKEGRRINPEIFSEGQRVTVQSRIARHHANGVMLMKDPLQILSFWIPGGYSQYMKISEDMIRSGAVLPIPEGISDEEAALTEPAACALESIFATPHPVSVDADGRHIYRSGIMTGGRTFIIGSGTLAMIYGLLAKVEGAENVWFVVRSQAKANLIRERLGNGFQIKILPDYSKLPLEDKLKIEKELQLEFSDLTNGELFDDVILAAPSIDAQRYMIDMLNPNGYAVAACFAGIREAGERIDLDKLHYRIGKVIGTSGCSTQTMETVLKWLAEKRISMKNLCCPEEFTLETDPEVFFTTAADGCKPMLYPWR